MPWEVILLDEVTHWFEGLDAASAEGVAAAVNLLEEHGPTLGRPLVDTLQGTTVANLKELRPGSAGSSEIRILFTFDPKRQAVLLVAGNKTGRWQQWYRDNIPVAEVRFREWLDGEHDLER